MVGTAILFREDGGIVHAAYAPVIVFPDTPYIRKIVAILRAGNAPGKSPFQRTEQPALWRQGHCDGKGIFRLDGLQELSYLVAVEFRWDVDYHQSSGTLISAIRLKPGVNNLLVTNWERTL